MNYDALLVVRIVESVNVLIFVVIILIVVVVVVSNAVLIYQIICGRVTL